MENNEKEKYKLWWEYLKLSDNYKKYCAHEFSSLIHLLGKIKRKEQKGTLIDISTLNKNELPASDLHEVFETFGNVFEKTFDIFWKEKGKNLKIKTAQSVTDFADTFSSWSSFYEGCCNYYGKEPSYNEFKKTILSNLKNNRERYLTVKMSQPISQIKKEFNAIVNQKAQREISKYRVNSMWWKCRNQRPTPNLRLDEVKRYLDVLKIYKTDKLKGKNAFNTFNQNKDYNEETKAVFYSDKRKGERIIKNVEKGYFPGNYEKV